MYIIYGRPNCRWCDSAVRLAKDKGIDFRYVDISEYPEAKKFLLSEGHDTVPQIYYRYPLNIRVYVGGFEAFEAELDDTDHKTDVPENDN